VQGPRLLGWPDPIDSSLPVCEPRPVKVGVAAKSLERSKLSAWLTVPSVTKGDAVRSVLNGKAFPRLAHSLHQSFHDVP